MGNEAGNIRCMMRLRGCICCRAGADAGAEVAGPPGRGAAVGACNDVAVLP